MNFKEFISGEIQKIIKMNKEEIIKYIEKPKDKNNGDYSFPCFQLAKTLKKSPQIIATEIKEELIKEKNDIIEQINVVGGYLNFYINKNIFAKETLNYISKDEKELVQSVGKGKTVLVEYSSPNIAKPFHIGHLRTTLIGNSLYKIYKYLGYNTISINHLGDYGTQFGKMIEAYKLWGNEYNLEEDPINKMMEMYVRVNELCKKDEKVLDRCRENFKKLEEGDEYCVDLWQKFKDLSLKEFDKIYDLLSVKFDSCKGEAFYSDKLNEVIEKLEESGKLIESNGAKIVNLEDVGIQTPCIIQKANGSSIYATRDLAAIMYRAQTYDFDKCLYVVGSEQNLHFKQVFEVSKYLVDEKYYNGLKHVSYGMVSLPTGRMSTREGNVVKIEDLINKTIEKADGIIAEKNPDIENREEVSKKVGIGAIVFNTLSTTTIKDQIFDWNTALNFQGETGPYIQYTYVRTKSILNKAETIPSVEEIVIDNLDDEYSSDILKLIYDFEEVLLQVTEKNEPSILSRYLIDLSKAFSSFYNENKIIGEEKSIQDARIYLTYAVGKILKLGASLLGMEMPEKM